LFGNNGHITLRAGRKGFIDLMLDHGQSLEDISAWLGHQNIEMTWQKYRNKKRVSFKPAG
jgi:integrase